MRPNGRSQRVLVQGSLGTDWEYVPIKHERNNGVQALHDLALINDMCPKQKHKALHTAGKHEMEQEDYGMFYFGSMAFTCDGPLLTCMKEEFKIFFLPVAPQFEGMWICLACCSCFANPVQAMYHESARKKWGACLIQACFR